MEGQDIGRRGASLRRRFRTRFALLALAAALAAAVAAGVAYAKTRTAPVGSGVVVIDTDLGYQDGQAAGTGMVLSSSGEILTNNHVIRGATTIRIVVPGTNRRYMAKVVGYDVSDDVAVLKAAGASNLKTVSVDTSAVKLGQAVRALGNAGGTGSLTSASGTVTALARSITVSDDQGGSERLTGLIETDAALRPGDSGGPLLDASGKVVGMDTAASVGDGFQEVASGDGYAISIGKAITIAKRIEGGKASATVHVGGTAFLGVSVGETYDGSGVVVETVVPGRSAAAAGLAPGDVIVSFAGRAVSSPAGLTAAVLAERPGARVTVVYLGQEGAEQSATLTLGSGPPQ